MLLPASVTEMLVLAAAREAERILLLANIVLFANGSWIIFARTTYHNAHLTLYILTRRNTYAFLEATARLNDVLNPVH